jgi:hypothetical protein
MNNDNGDVGNSQPFLGMCSKFDHLKKLISCLHSFFHLCSDISWIISKVLILKNIDLIFKFIYFLGFTK